MTDIFASSQDSLTTPIKDGEAIVLGGDQTYGNVTRAIHVSTAGTIVLILQGAKGTPVTLSMVLEVGWHPIRAVGHVAAGSATLAGTVHW